MVTVPRQLSIHGALLLCYQAHHRPHISAGEKAFLVLLLELSTIYERKNFYSQIPKNYYAPICMPEIPFSRILYPENFQARIYDSDNFWAGIYIPGNYFSLIRYLENFYAQNHDPVKFYATI